MTRPRLIILDTNRPIPIEHNFARRLARGLRSAQPARLILPIGLAKASEFHNPPPPESYADQWQQAFDKTVQALRQGQDVVMLGPLLGTPYVGQDWAEQLADKAGARLIARRVVPTFGDTPATDDRVGHAWPFLPFPSVNDGADVARKLTASIDRDMPGKPAQDAQGQVLKPSLYVVEARDADRRDALSRHLAKQTGAVILDLIQIRDKVWNTPPVCDWKESDYKQITLERLFWDQLEEQAVDALRGGNPVLLLGDRLSNDTSRSVADILARITDGEFRCVRVQKPGTASKDLGDGFVGLAWPQADSLDSAAQQLAAVIMTEDTDPSLDDLLDLPPADRRGPALF
ncbi:MAG: hypothetical protein Alpg2KO_05830 [Alphaproteobacteria bacterium]